MHSFYGDAVLGVDSLSSLGVRRRCNSCSRYDCGSGVLSLCGGNSIRIRNDCRQHCVFRCDILNGWSGSDGDESSLNSSRNAWCDGGGHRRRGRTVAVVCRAEIASGGAQIRKGSFVVGSADWRTGICGVVVAEAVRDGVLVGASVLTSVGGIGTVPGLGVHRTVLTLADPILLKDVSIDEST